jgi:hypothetical protein
MRRRVSAAILHIAGATPATTAANRPSLVPNFDYANFSEKSGSAANRDQFACWFEAWLLNS